MEIQTVVHVLVPEQVEGEDNEDFFVVFAKEVTGFDRFVVKSDAIEMFFTIADLDADWIRQ